MLSRNWQSNINFEDMFKPRLQNERNMCRHNDYIEEFNYIMQNNKFLIIRIASAYISYENGQDIYTEYPTLISNFDPNNVIIPRTTVHYRLQSAILFYPDQLHYTCIIRKNNIWIEISDTRSNLLEQFDVQLRHVYVLYLEKIE
jgi:hypothetical protein